MNDLEILNNDFGQLFNVHSSEFVPSSLPDSDCSGNSSSDTDSSDLDLEHLLDFELYPSETNNSFNVWGSLDSNVDKLSTMMLEPKSSVQSSFEDSLSEAHDSTNDQTNTEMFYLQWVDAIVVLKGGRIAEAELYEEMQRANATLYMSIMKEFGGIIPLMMKHPEVFKVINEAPFKWSIVSLNATNLGKPSKASKRILPNSRKIPKQQQPIIVDGPIDEKLVDRVIETATSILNDAPANTLKAVEMANALRANLGVDPLHRIKAHFGGLLSLLQKYPDTFEVKRIPKNDMVSLVRGGHFQQSTTCKKFLELNDVSSDSQCQALALLTSEKCVPGKAWPCDAKRDLPYVKGMVDILEKNERHYTPGGMTVSKLRGLLRLQIKSNKTIKSVPLKALIRGYSNIFNISGNTVTLASSIVAN